MYTLILVEDDQLICDGLSHFFPWKEIGFEFLGGFSDSLQAWDFIQNTPSLNVVLTDICMPGLSGLELANKLKSSYPYIWCCFLTAYQEFEYARKALSLGVKGYIDKPITISKVRDTLEMAEEVLSKSEADHEKIKKNYQEALSVQPTTVWNS